MRTMIALAMLGPALATGAIESGAVGALPAHQGVLRLAAEDRGTALARAYDNVVAARAALQEAEAARERGIEPLEGERLGTSSGGSRLSPAYWERQARLENEIAAARKRLDDAIGRLRALR